MANEELQSFIDSLEKTADIVTTSIFDGFTFPHLTDDYKIENRTARKTEEGWIWKVEK